MASLKVLENYGIQFQIKVISLLLSDKEFLTNIIDVLDPEFFPSQAHKWIVGEIKSYFSNFHTSPTLEVLKIELQKLQNDVLQVSIKEQLKNAYTLNPEDADYVKEEFTNFCKNQKLKSALLNSVNLLQDGNFEQIRDLIDDALKASQDKNIGMDFVFDIVERYKEDHR